MNLFIAVLVIDALTSMVVVSYANTPRVQGEQVLRQLRDRLPGEEKVQLPLLQARLQLALDPRQKHILSMSDEVSQGVHQMPLLLPRRTCLPKPRRPPSEPFTTR